MVDERYLESHTIYKCTVYILYTLLSFIVCDCLGVRNRYPANKNNRTISIQSPDASEGIKAQKPGKSVTYPIDGGIEQNVAGRVVLLV